MNEEVKYLELLENYNKLVKENEQLRNENCSLRSLMYRYENDMIMNQVYYGRNN